MRFPNLQLPTFLKSINYLFIYIQIDCSIHILCHYLPKTYSSIHINTLMYIGTILSFEVSIIFTILSVIE